MYSVLYILTCSFYWMLLQMLIFLYGLAFVLRDIYVNGWPVDLR